jgi:GntP family gluconate:H+ symporter
MVSTNGGPGLLLAILAAIVFIIVSGSRYGWHPFFSLLVATLGLGLLIGLPVPELFAAVREGFGGLLGSVGLLIVLGAIIGLALERSGAATRIAGALLGGGRPGLRLTVLGAVVSVPVFWDSGYIILAGLLPALAARSGRPVGVLALSLAGGLYLTHTLMPPTPGPLAAAANLGAADAVGTIMLLAAVVVVPVVFLIWRAAAFLGREVVATPALSVAEQPATLPALWPSLLPLVVPVGLIAVGTDPLPALLIGAGAALYLLPGGGRGGLIGEALGLAGPILVITGMGGAFGAVLKASSLATDLADYFAGRAVPGAGLLLLGFGVAAILKTAQGSSTGALVIASSIVFPLLPLAAFDTPVELALATLSIGAGAMTVSHANDSYFWVVTRFAGIEVGDAYRSYTVLTGMMGVGSLAMVLLWYALLT